MKISKNCSSSFCHPERSEGSPKVERRSFALLRMTGCALLLSMLLPHHSFAATDEETRRLLEQIKQLQTQQATGQPATGQTTVSQPSANPGAALPLPQVQTNAAAPNAPNNNLATGNPPPNQAVPIQIAPQPTLNPPRTSSFPAPFASKQIPLSMPEQVVQDRAFSGVVKGLLPMSPDQIHRLKQLYNASQYAAAAPAGVPPRPTATSIYVNLSPGATPPAIRLSEGFVSSLVFLDGTGAAWPIEAYDIGNPTAFDIQWDKKDNVLMIQAKTLYTFGNLAVRLRGLNTPVMLTLVPGQEVVDYRVDIAIPGYGPNAKALAINTGLPGAASSILLSVLDGIPPNGSRQLIISGGVGEGWLLKGKIYLRTRHTLLSPGWFATMSSADGTNAYELQRTPLLLLAQNGKVVNVRVEGL